jgi:geranylgeranyl reductase family protein
VDYDVIVVGAGPGGSSAAIRLARAGASVLLLDRARFPRDKPCGGGVTFRAVKQLPVPIDPVVEGVVSTMEIGLRHRRRFERTSAKPLALMTQRRRLDAYLAQQAAAAGAEFRDGARVTAVAAENSSGVVELDGARLQASVVIGADGVNGVTARALGSGGFTYGVALEGNAPNDDVDRGRYEGRLVLELGTIAGGYAWVFPKGDHVNVGVGGWESEGPRLREHLERYSAAHGLDADRLTDLRGYRLPLRSARSLLARGRVAFVGDAAGLVDPLSGDGIYEAALSARVAADAALDVLAGRAPDMAPYAAHVARALGRLHAGSWRAKRAIDRFPRATYEIVKTPFAWRVVEQLLRGEVANPSDVRGLSRAAFRVVERMGRGARAARATR